MSVAGARREVLFLQGLPGRFFRDLAVEIRQRGHGVHRINFNGGDVIAWGRAPGCSYRGSQGRWPAFLARFLVKHGVTDVILFGDCRPLHRAARATATGLGLTVHVFEEGYIRPDWVTLERDGVNGFSPMPSDPDWYRRAAGGLAPPDERPALPSSVGARARATLAYYAAAGAMAWAFPLYRTHRPWHPSLEALGWLARLARREGARRRSAEAVAGLDRSPYFIVPLQLESDYQLRAHSDFESMRAALARIITSFARHAPAEARLVVKEHPLDNGLNPWRRQALDLARALGVEARVVFVELGDIDRLVSASRGVVTVNSTTGALALAAGVPVVTLGRAVYDMAGLTHQGPLETFWTGAQCPDTQLYQAFRRVLAHRCLLWGGFYDQRSRTALVAAAVERILSPDTAISRMRRRVAAARPEPDPELVAEPIVAAAWARPPRPAVAVMQAELGRAP